MTIKRIDKREDLVKFAREHQLRGDWHEPDEVEIDAEFHGDNFDNAGFWGHDRDGEPRSFGEGQQEMYVVLRHEGFEVAEVNLATLFSWATEETAPAAPTEEVRNRASAIEQELMGLEAQISERRLALRKIAEG
jgi:hypothetical protein